MRPRGASSAATIEPGVEQHLAERLPDLVGRDLVDVEEQDDTGGAEEDDQTDEDAADHVRGPAGAVDDQDEQHEPDREHQHGRVEVEARGEEVETERPWLIASAMISATAYSTAKITVESSAMRTPKPRLPFAMKGLGAST